MVSSVDAAVDDSFRLLIRNFEHGMLFSTQKKGPTDWFRDLEADSLSRPFHYPRQCSSRIYLRSMAAAEKVLTNAKDVFSWELICLPPREFL